MLKLSGKFGSSCLRSGRTSSIPQPPFTASISYTRSRLLKVHLRFRVIVPLIITPGSWYQEKNNQEINKGLWW